jgi:hypothetical protein
MTVCKTIIYVKKKMSLRIAVVHIRKHENNKLVAPVMMRMCELQSASKASM